MISKKQQDFLKNLQARCAVVLDVIPDCDRPKAEKVYQRKMNRLIAYLKSGNRASANTENKEISRLMNLYKMHPWGKPLPFPQLRKANEDPEAYLDRIYKDYYEGEK